MILVIAGVNGAGKSSVVGSNLRAKGSSYFNPDEATQVILKQNPGMMLEEANGIAWKEGYDSLKRAIDKNIDFAFETTLGGNSICNELVRALRAGVEVSVLYCGLNSPELHVKRVAARVANGGHDIPESKIRERWANSIKNLEKLIPICTSVVVFDNSAELVNGKPSPIKLFAMQDNQFISEPIKTMPDWALSCAKAAIQRHIEFLE